MKIINIDGPDGSGKSSVVNILLECFESNLIKTKHIHFPRYDTELGKLIKEVLFNRTAMDPKSLQMLYSADRLNFTKFDVPKYEEELDILIVDRYTSSGLVYTQLEGGQPDDILIQEREVRKPDMNIILLVDPEISMRRMKNLGKDLDKFENTENQQKAFYYYKDIWTHLENIVYIDASQSLDEVVGEALLAIKELFKKEWLIW